MEPPAFRRQALTERWKLSIPDNGEQTHTLRYLPPEESGRLRLYLHTEAGWSQVQAREIGRYLVFPVTGNDIELAVCTVYLAPWVWACLLYTSKHTPLQDSLYICPAKLQQGTAIVRSNDRYLSGFHPKWGRLTIFERGSFFYDLSSHRIFERSIAG